jgi:hypothetical protein
MKTRMLSLFIAAALSAGSLSASAGGPPAAAPAPPTPREQAARAEIDRLVKRIEELAPQAGDDGDVRVIVRRGGHGAPMAFDPGERPMALPGGDGERRIRIERVGPDGRAWPGAPMPGEAAGFRHGPGLGIVMAPNAAANGVRVAAVTPDSPAMKAGIRSGDVLLAVDGRLIAASGDAGLQRARELLKDLRQDQVVKLRYARQGKVDEAAVRADAIRRVMAYNRDGLAPRARPDGDGHPGFRHEEFEQLLPPGIEMDIERIGPARDCGKGRTDCGLPTLYEAFRWQGLNLASIDAELGRYFGTERGVLVLSRGEDLDGLRSGDVIRRIGGVAVESPRDVMRALREKEAGSQLRFEVLRERKLLPLAVTVPASRPLPFIAPPPPPPPPRAPRAPHAAPPAPPPPPPAPAG